jgi:quercetin dioxygenase-like cupin family protein
MADTTVKKVDSKHSPIGEMGQTYLASGKSVSMRLWEEKAGVEDEPHSRPYETVGYVISGKAELHLEDQKIRLEAGDSWVVPEDAEHAYVILEPFVAVEATSPPARIEERDKDVT